MIYFLFSGNQYYPLGGAEDFKGVYDTLVDAEAAAATIVARVQSDWNAVDYAWWHIAECDGDNLTIVRKNGDDN